MIVLAENAVGLGGITNFTNWLRLAMSLNPFVILHKFSAPRARASWGEFSIIPHRQHFVKQKVAQILLPTISRICATLPLVFWGGVWYTIIVPRERTAEREAESVHHPRTQKNLKKTS